MAFADVPGANRLALGVARISYGLGPYRPAMQALADAAAKLYGASGTTD